jgi:hypothetical protein
MKINFEFNTGSFVGGVGNVPEVVDVVDTTQFVFSGISQRC